MSRRQGVAVLAAGLVLLIAAPFAWAGLTPDPAGETVTDLNAAAARALAAPTTSAAEPGAVSAPAESPSAADPSPTSDPSPAGDPVSTAEPATVADPPDPTPVVPATVPPAPAPVATPVRLVLPTLGIDNPVIPVGVTDAGDLQIPDDVDDVGWYRFGPAPGADAGSAVLTGHVDDARQGAGPLSRLGELAEGDTLVVVDESGVSREFTMLAREEWSKSAVPMDRLFDRGGSPRLVLITCGGEFDARTGHYEDNVAITAVPVATTPGGPA